jgi:cyclopropane-fatty-acyl-phospholipid synthase
VIHAAIGTTRTPAATPWQALTRQALLKRLGRIGEGRLVLEEEGRIHRFGTGQEEAVVRVRDPRFWTTVALGGGTGAGDAWAEGSWDSPDLVAVIRLLARNRPVLQGLDSGPARLGAWLGRLAHRMRANTTRGSRRNIAAHYDLGNDFYRLFLDGSLSYSSALWAHPDQSLEEAQTHKIDRLCRDLALQPHHHLLEIGTGWGSLAIHAARHYGCRVTTTTISAEQRDLARQRIQQAGLEQRITVLDQDYRALTGSYDRLVSVEMIEAVGHEYLGVFVETCSRLLRPDGRMALQAITYPDQGYESYRRRADFIQRRIFPGSCLVSLAHLHRQLAGHSDLRPVAVRDLTEHYARTLAIWRTTLANRRGQALELGYTENFLRLWDFYFAYCEGGFREHVIGDLQLLLAKPGARPDNQGNWA